MQEALKNSLNLSNEFRLKDLNDPINYQVSLRDSVPEISEVPLRYTYKERKIKERDSFGGYRYYSDNLKKRKNPTEEYKKQLEEELMKKKKILSDYESNGGRLSQEQMNSIKNRFSPPNTLSQNNFYSASYFNDVNDINERDIEYYQNLSANDNLLKVLDSQVDLLKRKGDEQFKKLSQSDEYNHLSKTKKYGRLLQNKENGLEEPGVFSQFLAANNNRIQTLKHVITQDKPEYIPLEDLSKMKEEHEKELLDIEDEYYGRKKISEEELMRRREEKKRLKRLKELNNMIQRPGYNNDKPLEQKDYEFIDKYNSYLINKQGNIDKIGYEEEWNTTKIKSQNANGIVDRNDGLPGYLDQDDHKLYYYDINEEGGELNFERPLKTHKHIGRENTLKRTFRNEPGYEKTKGQFYRTGSMPDMTYTAKENIKVEDSSNGFNCNNTIKIINDKNNSTKTKDNIDITKNTNKEENELNKKINEKNEQFIRLIFGMLTKNERGQVLKNRIISEMKLDENSIRELGFRNREDFENKLSKYPSKDKNFMTEKEFYNFILQKKSKPKKIKMVNYQEENNNQNTNEISFTKILNNNQKTEFTPHLSEYLIKNNKPFIPKNFAFKNNNNQNRNVLNNKTFLETKFMKDNLNRIIIPMDCTNTDIRKNSAEGECYSTCDELSPVKVKDTKVKKTFPKKKKKKKGNKSPFKGEAKDFKIKYKTELCKYYECDGYCKYGDKCAYAHGKENLRSKVTNTTAYRTKKCTQFFEQGYCPYGNRCQFAHGLKTNIINNPYDKGMSYCKILETISKLENVGNIKKLVEKPRLPVFEELCKNEEGIESRLLNDIKKLKQCGLYKRIEM